METKYTTLKNLVKFNNANRHTIRIAQHNEIQTFIQNGWLVWPCLLTIGTDAKGKAKKKFKALTHERTKETALNATPNLSLIHI